MACNSRWSSCRIDVEHRRNCQPVFGLLVLGAGWRRSLPNCPRAPMLPKTVVYLTTATARETLDTSSYTICNPVLRRLYLSPVVGSGVFTSQVWCPLLSLAFQEYLMHLVCYKMTKISCGLSENYRAAETFVLQIGSKTGTDSSGRVVFQLRTRLLAPES